jgi:ribonuclease R
VSRAGGGGSTQLAAVLERRGRFFVAQPLFERGRSITVERDRRAGEGQLVLLRLGARGAARIERVLGRPDVARDVIEALMLNRGLRRGFEPAVDREAAAAGPDPSTARRDLRELETFTVDPASARDFDDAISAQELAPGHWRVWVHIADVAAHVPPGSLVDHEARRRATSVYVPGAVEPMLPEALSNVACSLVPGEDRPAVTVELDLRGARTERVAFHRSLIRSDARLDYDRVDRIFAGAEPAQEPWAAPLAAARAVAAELDRARAARGALAVETVEPEFVFDLVGRVEALRPTQQTESHRLIEHLMIAANEAVATLLEERKLPALYRVHERPEPQRVQFLVAQLASLDVATPALPDHLSPQQAGDAAAECSRLVDEHVRRTGRGRRALTALVLRSLKQAHYSPANLGHAGLRSPRYCHFTSPIRRYPDLVCHRALLAAVGAGEHPPPAAEMEDLGSWTSARERDAMRLERDADDVARCFLLESELFRDGWERDWEGEVVGLIGAGAFVAFGAGHEGLLPARRLPGEWWELNEEGTILRGTRTGKALRLGDPVRVRVERVDAPRGRVDLLPVEL